MDLNKIYNEDCLVGMKRIPDKSVDCIICDLPYGQLNKSNKYAGWDKPLPMDKVWELYERITKDNGAILLFAQGMFTAKLMLSNEKIWRYNLVWRKGGRCSGGNGDTAFLLLDHPVHGCATFMHFSDLVGFTRIEKDAFRSRGLTGIDVSHDTDITNIM